MKKSFSILSLIFCAMVLMHGSSFAQLTGTKTIPGDYATITAAVTDLNTVGVGLGGVTFNVAAGYTESNVNVVLTCTTNPPTAQNPITFQKSGAGANPLLTAGVGVSTTVDGIFKLNGVSYVTIDGIDLQESAGNTDATTQMEWGYALVKQSGVLACQFTVIKNCIVTLNKSNANSCGIYIGNHLATSTTALTVSNFRGTTSYNKFYNNTVQNCFIGIQLQGFSAATPFDFYDQGNEVGTIAGGRSQVLNFGNGTSALSAYGIRSINQNYLKIFNTNINSTGGADNNSTLNGIFLSTATGANVELYGDTVTVVSGATSSQLMGINCDAGSTGNGNTLSIHHNVVQNCSYPGATTGEFRAINMNTNASATYTQIYENKILNNTLPGTGVFSGIAVFASSSTTMLQTNVYNNVISNNVKTGTGGNMFLCSTSTSSQAVNVYGNVITNNSNALSSGTTYGTYNFAIGFIENCYNNTVTGLTGGTGETVGIFPRSGSTPAEKMVYGNTVSGISGAGTVGGIYFDYASNGYLYNNNIFNITSTSISASPGAYGIQYGTTGGLNLNINNNFISDIKSPNNTSTNSVYGIWIAGSSATNAKIYYNTVYLNATTSATTFGSSAMFISSTPSTVDARNNILVNVSAAGSVSGRTIALQRALTTFANYNLLSGNNCLYAGTPGAQNVIYFDGTNADQTLQAFKDRVTPREQASFTEIPPFINVATTPYNLHVQTGIGTQTEKGGQPVNVTLDYDGTTRNATNPDVGADEFTGTMNDIASPNIQYTLLTNDGATTTRTLTNFAAITDPSGINNTVGTRPRLYYKKSTQANTYNDNTSATDGWKYVEASNTSSPFSFTMNYTQLFSGSVVAGDIIQYFVTAQDLNATPRIGLNAGAYTTQPASVNLAAANFPLTSTINQYTITATSYSGSINVGSAEAITSLTNAGGLFALINAGTLSGNLTVNITSDLLAETGTFALNQFAETGTGGFTLTIQPGTGSTKTINGTSTSGLIRLDGADRVRFDGRFGGSGQFLTFRNTSTSAATLLLLNDAQNNIIRNCVFEGNSTLTTGNTAGVINIGTTTGPEGNDNNTITFNDIRDRSDAAGNPVLGIASTGTTTTYPQYNNNITVSNNTIHDYFLNGSTLMAGINVLTGNYNWNIDSNSIYQTVTRSHSVTGSITSGINISNTVTNNTTGGFNLRRNYIGGTAPLCGGTALTITTPAGTTTTGFRGMSVISGLIPNFIQNNTIANIDWTTNSPAANTVMFAGIGTGNGIHNITGNTIGSTTGNDNILMTINGTGAGISFTRAYTLASFTATMHGGIIDNNAMGSITIGGTNTAGVIFEGCSIQGSNGVIGNVSISNNTMGSLTTANSIRTTYTTPLSQMLMVRNLTTSAANVTIDNNRIQNITDNSTNASNLLACIISAAATFANPIITNNVISNISSNTSAAFSNDIVGIQVNSNSTAQNVSGNTINSLNLTNAGAFNTGAIGIAIFNNNSAGSLNGNRIAGMTSQSTGAGPSLFGKLFFAGNNWVISNNMVTMTNGEAAELDEQLKKDTRAPYVDRSIKEIPAGYNTALLNVNNEAFLENSLEIVKAEERVDNNEMAEKMKSTFSSSSSNSRSQKNEESQTTSPDFTNNVTLYGIFDQSSATSLAYYNNSVYVGGTSGTLGSSCFNRFSNANTILRNNLFVNARTGTGMHYALSNASVSNGWNSVSSNYNAYVTVDSNVIGSWIAVDQSLTTWRTVTGGDNYTWYAKTSQVAPSSLFTSISTGDLHVNSSNAAAWLVSGKGTPLSVLSTDIDGNSRSTSIAGGVTDIGADEFTAAPPSNPVALQSAPPASGTTTDYVLYGRKIASITWGTGGTYPTSMNVNYFSGVSPVAPNVTNPQRVSNSYWTAAPGAGTFGGTTYDITYYYGDNETFSITSPSTNVLLAKNDNNFWMSYPRGTGSLQSEQTGTSVTARGMLRFSSFTLTDAGLPAERPLTPVNNATSQPLSVTLVWNKSALASTYRVQVATDSLFNTLVLNDSTVTDSTRLVSGLANGTNYWWRVNGKSGAGTGAWCQVYRFTTQSVAAPITPVLFSPTNNATNQALSLNLVWFKSTGATSYRVQLATDSLFTNIIVNDSTLTDSIRAVSGLNNSTNYWWRVNAKNVAGTSAFTAAWKFTTAPLAPAVVNLSVIPGGFYNTGTGRLNMRDTIRVYLVDSATCVKVDSTRGVVDSVNFQASISFSNAATGNYYMLVYHRNHLAVATRFKTTVTRGSTVSYDFTNDSAKAFGFNMIKVSASPVRWGLIPGDANRDGFTDGLDQTIWIGQNGFDGYLSADFNGDFFVDGLDQTIWILYNGNSSFLPCGFFFNASTDKLEQNTPDSDAKKMNMMIHERKRLEGSNSTKNQK